MRATLLGPLDASRDGYLIRHLARLSTWGGNRPQRRCRQTHPRSPRTGSWPDDTTSAYPELRRHVRLIRTDPARLRARSAIACGGALSPTAPTPASAASPSASRIAAMQSRLQAARQDRGPEPNRGNVETGLRRRRGEDERGSAGLRHFPALGQYS